jgi:hypothetical protein
MCHFRTFTAHGVVRAKSVVHYATERLEQRRWLFEIGRVKALREPAVDRGEAARDYSARLVAAQSDAMYHAAIAVIVGLGWVQRLSQKAIERTSQRKPQMKFRALPNARIKTANRASPLSLAHILETPYGRH